MIEWTTGSKKILFLKHRVEIILAGLYLKKCAFKKSFAKVEKLLEEIRKIDDKHLLVEILLLESRIWMALENNAKAKSSLTAAKSSANSIYVPPLLQAQIDFM